MRFLRLCFVIFVLRRFFRLPIILLVVVVVGQRMLEIGL